MGNSKEAEMEANVCMISKSCSSDDQSTETDGSEAGSLTGSQIPERGNWGRQIDFLFSCIGYAVGLGNLWRFPYLCMRNGGGAFLIPYFFFLVLCGIPLYFMELCVGQFSSRSPMSMWALAPIFKGLGYGMILVSGIVCIYYNVIMAWGIYYLYIAFTGFKTGTLPWSSCDNEWNTDACVQRGPPSNATFNVTDVNSTVATLVANVTAMAGNITLKAKTPTEEFWERHVLELSSGIDELGGIRWELLLCLLIAWVIVFACLCKGVQSSGKVVYVTATAPYVMLLILFVRGVTLPGSKQGILFYLTPDFSRLLHFNVWVEACAQIFYSLGPAYGGLITMASYNRFHNNCYRDAMLIPVINCLTSFFAGFVVFSVIGFLAHTAQQPVADVITSGPGLAFIVYPEALALLPYSPIWAVVFFTMLVIIGLDTQFGMFETMTSGFVDEFPKVLMGRKTLFTALMCCVQFLLGIPIVTRGGMYIFQIMDWYSATFSLMTISSIEVLVLAWRYGVRRMYDDIELMIGYKPSAWWGICWKFITPFILLCVIVFTMVTFSTVSLGSYVYPQWAVGMGWLMAMCSILPIPIVIIVEIARSKGTLWQRIVHLSSPTDEWGPSSKDDRKGTIYALPASRIELT